VESHQIPQPPAFPGSSLSPAKPRAPLVGRGTQLAWLESRLDDAIGGRPGLVLLSGAGGLGKTRLVKEFELLARAARVWVCSGRAYQDLAHPYLPMVEVLRDQLGDVPEAIDRVLGSDAERLATLVRGEAFLGGAESAGASVDTLESRMGLFVAVSRATIELARIRPTLLVIDDLHWADDTTIQQLVHLVFGVSDAARRAPVPLLIVAVYRPPEPDGSLERAIDRFERESICQSLALAELDEDEVRALIVGLGVERPSRQVVRAVTAVARGNPLFVEAVVDQLFQQEALCERGGFLTLSKDLDDLALPSSLFRAIDARRSEVSQRCCEALSFGASLGDSFEVSKLASVSGLGEAELLELLEEAFERRLLLCEGETFEFRHPLIRHVFYSAPSAARRQRIHARIAESLETQYGAAATQQAVEIAYHLERAGPAADLQTLAEFARLAGDVAFARFAWGESARFYERAAATGQQLGRSSASEQAELHCRAGIAHYRNMDVGPALERFDAGIEAYRQCGDSLGVARVLLERTRAQNAMVSGHFGAFVDVVPLQEALQQLPEEEAGLRGSASAILAEAHFIGFQPEEGARMARQALALGRQTKDPRLCAHALVALALCQLLRVQLVDALASLEEGLRQAHLSGDPWIEGWPLQRLPLVLNGMGRLADAEHRAEEACRQSRRTHDWAGHSLALAALTSAAVARGEFAAAEDYAQQALAAGRRSHYPWGAGMALPALAYAHGLRGEWAAAQRVSDVLMEPGSVFTDAGPAFQFHTRVFRELLDALRGTPRKGGEPLAIRALAAAPPGPPDNNLLAAFCPGVETAREIGDPKLAIDCSAPIALAAERGMVFPSVFPFLLHRLLGVARAMNEHWEPAEQHFRKAEAIATEIGARPELGRVYLDYSRMLAERSAEGDRTRAADLLWRASSIFDEFGMQPFVDKAAQLAAQLGVRPPESPQTPVEAAAGRGPLSGEQSLGQTERAEEVPVVLLETDMEGSTALIDRVGDERAQAVKRTHDLILRACIRAYRAAPSPCSGTSPATTPAIPMSPSGCA